MLSQDATVLERDYYGVCTVTASLLVHPSALPGSSPETPGSTADRSTLDYQTIFTAKPTSSSELGEDIAACVILSLMHGLKRKKHKAHSWLYTG